MMIGVAGLALITILGPGQEVVTITALCLLESSSGLRIWCFCLDPDPGLKFLWIWIRLLLLLLT